MMQVHPGWVIEFHGRKYPITVRGLRIGRGQDNDVVLQDDQASRHHATIWIVQGSILIRDEGSTNGTFVNGKRLATPSVLRPGDVIQIGQAILHARLGSVASNNEQYQPLPRASNSVAGWATIAGTGFVLLLLALLGAIAIIRMPSGQSPLESITGIAQRISPTASTPTALAALSTPSATSVATIVSVPSATWTASPSPTVSSATNTNRALMAAVLIVVPTDRKDAFVTGSGSIVDARGLILTNLHVVRDPDTKGAYNSQDFIGAAINSSPERTPDRLFRAQLVQSDQTLDLAVLRLIGTDEGKPLPADLNLSVMPLGNSDTVLIGDRVQAIGFPAIGGSTVTLVSGSISGFLRNRFWIKTDATISQGNSGGMAINAAGELIGIPTEVVRDPELAGQLGLLRPINLAKPLIEKAK